MAARLFHLRATPHFPLLLPAATATLPTAATKLVALGAEVPKIDANNLPDRVQMLKWGSTKPPKGQLKSAKRQKFASHYPDISGAVGLDETGEVIFIHSAGVCRQGCAKDIKLFAASITGLTGVNPAAKVTTLAAGTVDLDALRQLLRLSADATPQDINKAVTAALTASSALDGVDETLPLVRLSKRFLPRWQV